MSSTTVPTTPKPGLRERRNERTRQAITRAVLELTQELGFDRTTIAQIADRAEVSPRTVHAWFPTKEAIVVGNFEGPRDRLAAELASGGGDILDRLRRWVENEGEHRTEPDELARLRHRVLLADPHLRAVWRANAQAVEDLLASAIAAEVSLPADAVAPRALAAAILTTLLALQERFIEDANPDSERFAGFQEMLRAGLNALRDRA
jgi:AcrR family transcriptional regulator